MNGSNLPSTIGLCELTPNHTRLWGADAAKFNPIIHVEAPQPLPPPNGALPTATGQPVALLPETNFIPKEYQLHIHCQACLRCGTGSEWSVLYAHNSRPARAGEGKPISHLVPVERFSYNVPVRIIRAKVRTIPACQECIRTQLDLSALPKPVDTAEYQRIMNPQAQAATIVADPTLPKSNKPKPTIEDL